MVDQVFLLTGAAGGIGSELARILVGRGDSVVLFGRRAEPLETLAAELGPKAVAVSGDARNANDLAEAVAHGIEVFGRLDGLAHCVGSIRLKPLHLTTPEEFAETVETNLMTAFLASRAVLEVLRKQNAGSIVLLSSVAAGQGLNNHESIAAAKAGIEGLVRSAAITYARQEIRFNAVAPALIETPLAAPLLRTEASRAFSRAMHPLGRLGRPEDVARVIAFLLGRESSWITGQVWGVDGGLGAGASPPRAMSAN
jgi:NAD(P)-dependent dehydrogenase (short-subunit alcohol dehydrogenase family)